MLPPQTGQSDPLQMMMPLLILSLFKTLLPQSPLSNPTSPFLGGFGAPSAPSGGGGGGGGGHVGKL